MSRRYRLSCCNHPVHTIYLKSVYHRLLTPTDTRGCCCNHFFYISWFSLFSFQAGCGESFANWIFAEETCFTCLFLLSTPELSSSWMIPPPVSCSCQLKLAITEACYSCARCKSAELQGLQTHFSPRP